MPSSFIRIMVLSKSGMWLSSETRSCQHKLRYARFSLLNMLTDSEIMAMTLLVLPWCPIFRLRAASTFTAEDAGAAAWSVVSAGYILLLIGNICAYLSSAVALRSFSTPIMACGRGFPTGFRIALCWALRRMRRTYRQTGLDFHLLPFNSTITIFVACLSVIMRKGHRPNICCRFAGLARGYEYR